MKKKSSSANPIGATESFEQLSTQPYSYGIGDRSVRRTAGRQDSPPCACSRQLTRVGPETGGTVVQWQTEVPFVSC
jgi:hypothetical protein